MTAKGKINASKVQAGDRILVRVEVLTGGRGLGVDASSTKTGEGVQVARVTGKAFREAQGRYEARGKYVIETTAGTFEAAAIQTMWLAPEDAAGIKRAHVEALAEDARYDNEHADAILAHQEEAWTADRDEQIRIVRVMNDATQEEAEAYLAEAHTAEQEAAGDTEMNDCEAYGCDIPEGHPECRRCGAESQEYDLPECPSCGGPLASDGVCADLDGNCDPDEELTLHSQGGKVDNMNKPSNAHTVDTETFEQITSILNEKATPRPATGSAVVRLLEKVWTRIREDHPELPEVVIVTGSGLAGDSKWGHFRANGWKLQEEGAATSANMHEMFMAGETLAKGSAQVLQTMLHEGAHTLARVRDLKDTSRQGRWHNQTFRKMAEEMGLNHPGTSADKSHGFSFVKLTEETKARYADLLTELDREINLVVKLPVWMGGEADEDEQGGEKITGKPKGEDKPKTGNVKTTCRCDEPNIIRMSKKVLEMAIVRCDDCDSLFAERD